MRRAALIALFGWMATACASAPPAALSDACAVADTVLTPILAAAGESGDRAELVERTQLWPHQGSEAWARVQELGFTPVWRDAATDAALREAYWRHYLPLQRDRSLSAADADFQAWQAAYVEVGDDRIYADPALWRAFLTGNRRAGSTPCAADLATRHDADLAPSSEPRGARAVRLTPARPVFNAESDRALMAAQTIYPGLNAGDPPRVTGTVWLLRKRATGGWQVLSARRTDGFEAR